MDPVSVPATEIRRSRPVESIHPARAAQDGAGVKLWRNLGPELHGRLDPFLMLDEFSSDDPNDYIAGFPDHPHRGFETITYMLAGAMEHRDSAGNHGLLGPGSVQWMKAARGVIHSEMPRQESGLMRGFQLWLNLPAAEKMDDPSYRDLAAQDLGSYRLDNGAKVKLIAGQSHGLTGPAEARATEPLYLDLVLPARASFSHLLPAGHNAFVYVYQGGFQIGDEAALDELRSQQLAILGHGNQGDGVRLTAQEEVSRALLLAGKPLHETVVQHGPFVMNSREEIAQAFADYQGGRLTR